MSFGLVKAIMPFLIDLQGLVLMSSFQSRRPATVGSFNFKNSSVGHIARISSQCEAFSRDMFDTKFLHKVPLLLNPSTGAMQERVCNVADS
jgi:hypothetical protein